MAHTSMLRDLLEDKQLKDDLLIILDIQMVTASMLAADFEANAAKIDAEMIDCQGSPVEVGGYFKVDPAKAAKAMRPSATLNAIIDAM